MKQQLWAETARPIQHSWWAQSWPPHCTHQMPYLAPAGAHTSNTMSFPDVCLGQVEAGAASQPGPWDTTEEPSLDMSTVSRTV